MEETTVCHGRLNHKEEDEKGEKLESALHSNLSFYGQEDNQPSDVHEGHTNLLYEECNQHVEVSFSNVLKKDLSMPTYDGYEDDYLNIVPKEPTVCNHRLDHLEEAEGPKWDASSCSSNLECQEEYISPDFLEEEEESKWDILLCFSNLEITLLDFIKEHNEISFKIY